VVDTVQRLDACDEIARLKSRYVKALEERDWDGWSNCFTENATAQFMPAPGETEAEVHRGRAHLRGWVTSALEGAYVVIRVSMPDIEILDEHHARGDWAQVERLAFPEGPLREATYYGYYHETYEKGGEGLWRIASVTMSRIRNDVVQRDGESTVNLDILDRLTKVGA
jgi:hypothetical protein